MNASGRPNTCKSRGIVAILETGARVRNAYERCPELWDSPRKRGLIPDGPVKRHLYTGKAPAVLGPHAYD